MAIDPRALTREAREARVAMVEVENFIVVVGR